MFLLISPYLSPCVLLVSCPPNSGSPYVMQNQAEIPSVVNYLDLHIGKVVLPCGLHQNSWEWCLTLRRDPPYILILRNLTRDLSAQDLMMKNLDWRRELKDFQGAFLILTYMRSKIMMIDDCISISLIGSANINDKSLLGSRDSEEIWWGTHS
ncbi:uncharacterized protein LOC114290274 [Camellia sinensis]|uniref:uncharacterized protein LOC114290274 n=1 Tax=Camellia sinensis TaxID=4442 RepID=UPI001035AEF1|nr:uncharacterized protein LOC114290274 [Camellia sinensis]